jgi:HEAT repeat protein
MPSTVAQLRSFLDAQEPDYRVIARSVTPDDVPVLSELARSSDIALASKATYTLTLIGGPAAKQALSEIVPSAPAVVRVAAAYGLQHLTDLDAFPLPAQLLDDSDVGVRKHAIKSLRGRRSEVLNRKLQQIAAHDPEPRLRALANEALHA